jgi:hypothetical protein
MQPLLGGAAGRLMSASPLTLRLADAAGRSWAQAQIATHHYLHTRVPNQCRPLAYLVEHAEIGPVGCLIFGRPQAQRCSVGGFTYGSLADVCDGRAFWECWEIINLARVWLEPSARSRGLVYGVRAQTSLRSSWRMLFKEGSLGSLWRSPNLEMLRSGSLKVYG